MLNDPSNDYEEFGIDSAGMNAERDRQMYADLGLFNPADDEAYFSNQGDIFYDPSIGEAVFRPYTPEEFEYLTTGQTGFKTGPDSFVDYVGGGQVETGDGNRRSFYTPDGGFVDYKDITNQNARVETYDKDGNKVVYQDGKVLVNGKPAGPGTSLRGVLESLLKAGVGANAIRDAIRNKPGGFERATGAAGYQARELPQSAIRRAASGGLMGLATGGSTSQFQSDWNAFFSDAVEPGFVHNLGGGSKVTKMHDGTAIYQGPNGEWIPFDKNTNPTFLARQATGLAQDWQNNESYQTATNAPAGSQTRLDPAASGFYFDENGFVVQRRPEGMGGDYTYKFNINDIQDPTIKAYYQANPDLLAASGASAVSNYSTNILSRGTGAGLTSAQATPEDFYNNYFHGYGGVGGAASQVSGGGVGGGTVYNPVSQQPYQYNPSDIYNNPQYGNVGDAGIDPIVSSTSPTPLGAQPLSVPYQAIRHSSRLLPEETRPGSAWDRGGGQVLFQQPVRTAAAGGLMGLATGGGVDDWVPGSEYDKSKLPVYFDWQKYVAANSDLGQAGIDTQQEAERHYALYGQSEGRTLGMTGREITDAVSSNWQQQQQNTAAAATGKTAQAKQLWEQFGQDPAKLRQAAHQAGITGGDLAAATGYDPKIMSNYMQQWLNPAITRYSSIDDMAAGALAARNDTSGFVIGPMNAPTMKDYYDKNPSASPFTEGWLAPTKPATPATPPVASQPYPHKPGDIYNRSPVYADINSPGVNPIVSSRSPMPMGGNAVTKPYEAVRYSSRLLPEETRPGSAWTRAGGQVIYNPITAASGGLMGLQDQTNLGRYAGGGLGRLVQGPGDGVSDSVPAMIGGQQPALIAQGEYVLPARVVSELGNGSTEAGAQRIDQMVAKIEQMGKSAGRGKDSGAHQLLG